MSFDGQTLSTEIVPAKDKEELQQKIIACADTIFLIHQEEIRSEQTVREAFQEILDDATRLSVDKAEVRRMLHEALSARGPKQSKISEVYIRKLLPPELKYEEFERKDYKVKRQFKSSFEGEVVKQVEQTVKETEIGEIGRLKLENKNLREEVQSLRDKLATSFEVYGILKVDKNLMPIKVRVNANSRAMESAELDTSKFRNQMQQEYRTIKQRDETIAAARSKK